LARHFQEINNVKNLLKKYLHYDIQVIVNLTLWSFSFLAGPLQRSQSRAIGFDFHYGFGMLVQKLLIGLSCSLLINCCASFESQPGPNYVALYGSVARVMSQQVKPMTPPIVFVQDSRILGEMFPDLSKPGENLLGVYWCGMVYLSQENLSDPVIAHEFSHYLGANERTAEIVSEVCTRQGAIISAGSKKSGEFVDLVEVTAGTRGTRAAGIRSLSPK